ncbi:MAG: 50S ribosomal protein L11 methyltransferase [Chitinophagia bacterium]|jgi:ribosomal protein L11 methyltransferase
MDTRTCAITIQASSDLQELLVAQLSEIGFDGFEQTETTLIAYMEEAAFNSANLELILNQYSLTTSKSIIEKTNWNAVWESNFQPIQIGNRLGVRAHFHPPIAGVEQEIIITPKMSFGTGHHATTSLVMEMMFAINLQDQSLLDFGTGTGILAILGKMLGAKTILAVDNDDWCIENALENCKVNGAGDIEVVLSDRPIPGRNFNTILANINRHILLEHLPALVKQLNPGGQLIISGLLKDDEVELEVFCNNLGLLSINKGEKNGWIALGFLLPIAI